MGLGAYLLSLKNIVSNFPLLSPLSEYNNLKYYPSRPYMSCLRRACRKGLHSRRMTNLWRESWNSVSSSRRSRVLSQLWWNCASSDVLRVRWLFSLFLQTCQRMKTYTWKKYIIETHPKVSLQYTPTAMHSTSHLLCNTHLILFLEYSTTEMTTKVTTVTTPTTSISEETTRTSETSTTLGNMTCVHYYLTWAQ